jgi:PAS domain S-box-containing protein
VNGGPAEEPKGIICAPHGKDAKILARLVELEGIPSQVHRNLSEITCEILGRAAFLLISEEALYRTRLDILKEAFSKQEPWSDLPIILLATGGAVAPAATSHFISSMSGVANISILERPARVPTIGSALRVAASARRRQFQVRDLLRREKKNLEDLNRAMQDLKVSEESSRLLASIVDSSEDAIVSKDLNGVITSWNGGAVRLFGYSSLEAVGRPITIIIPPERLEEEPKILNRIRRGESVEHFETIRLRKDGAPLDISLTISPVRDASGKIVGASKVARNITAQRRSQEALRESESRLRELTARLESDVQARTAELQKRNVEVLRKSEELRELSVRLMAAQDEERRHLARELHDSAGQTITALGMNLARVAALAKTHAPQLSKDADESALLIRQLNHEIRTASYLLHPPLLDEAGLAAATEAYVRGVEERGGPVVTVEINGEFGRLPNNLELVVFRVVQESLTNVIRHANSKDAAVRIRRTNAEVVIEIQDFGKGMSRERLAAIQSQGSGVGIRGMRERIRHFGGEMVITSNSAGTTIQATIPLPKNEG